MLVVSLFDGQAESKVSKWKSVEEDDEAGDDEQMEGGGSSTRLDIVDESDPVNNDCKEAHGRSAHGGANGEFMLPVLSFEDDNDEEEREHWQTMFLMENHRKYGTPLPLKEAFLSLHDTREEEG